MEHAAILLVEDNPDDQALALRALKQNNLLNQVVLANDGAEAQDYLFGTGAYAERDPAALPQVVLLDLKLPKIDGLEVLRRLRADPRTELLPVVILTSSKEEQDLITGYKLAANSYIRIPGRRTFRGSRHPVERRRPRARGLCLQQRRRP